MKLADEIAPAPVRKSIAVKATPDHAFRVFTEGVDSWEPRNQRTYSPRGFSSGFLAPAAPAAH